jgi:hypothetical protein
MITKSHNRNHLGNIGLKILALCFGYLLWHVFSQTNLVSVTISAPLCFDATNELYAINAPETIAVTLAGTRRALASLDFDTLAIHLDANKLTPQEHTLCIAKKNLFLPDHINLVHYEPSPLVISVIDKSENNQEQQGARE